MNRKSRHIFYWGYGIRNLTPSEILAGEFSDLSRWRKLSLFVEATPNIGSPDFWQTLLKNSKRMDQIRRIRGFHPIPLFTIRPFLRGSGPNKPIVFRYLSGRRQTRKQAVKIIWKNCLASKLINAIQVATMDIAEVALISAIARSGPDAR